MTKSPKRVHTHTHTHTHTHRSDLVPQARAPIPLRRGLVPKTRALTHPALFSYTLLLHSQPRSWSTDMAGGGPKNTKPGYFPFSYFLSNSTKHKGGTGGVRTVYCILRTPNTTPYPPM